MRSSRTSSRPPAPWMPSRWHATPRRRPKACLRASPTPTTTIGGWPTYHEVGRLPPVLLVLLRLMQGFGAGAEISGAGLMLAEYAPPHRRGFVASLVGLGTNCGTLFASAIWAVLLGTLVE